MHMPQSGTKKWRLYGLFKGYLCAFDEPEIDCQGCHTAAKKKETTMSQMTSFEKAVNAWVKLSAFVRMVTVTARNAHAPVGRGSKTSPAHAMQCTADMSPEMADGIMTHSVLQWMQQC
jgi:hypothetical protein